MRKNRFNYLFLLLTIVWFSTSCTTNNEPNEEFDCFSVLVGKNATVDGSVMFAHNEDDGGKQIVNRYKVPHLKYSSDEVLVFKNGATLLQAEETNSYIWLELPGMSFSDSYLNQYGVCIASDACSSREKNPVLTEGGIGYSLRRIMAERSKTAREAVKIGGKLVSEFGYTSSGRTYCISDPEEAWMLSVVHGKHWIAQRVPDNHVAVIPNYYTIGEVNLADTLNYLGSPDIIEYAIKRGWFDPDKGPFKFREAYSAPRLLKSKGNINRMWRGIDLLTEKNWNVKDDFPFSFKPYKKIELRDLMKILRDHYEGTKLYNDYENPHTNDQRKICTETNQFGFVAQLRNSMPVDIGAVLWIAPRKPCIQSFIPWYSGIIEIPDGFARKTYKQAINEHFDPSPGIYNIVPDLAYWHYYLEAEVKPDDYKKFIEEKKSEISVIEKYLLDNQNDFEKEALEVYQINKDKALQIITEYTTKWTNKTLEK